MGVLNIGSKCNLCGACIAVCPFGAIEQKGDGMEIGAACKMCRLCLKKCPAGAISFIDGRRVPVNKEEWKGILVFVEHLDGEIHPVTLELIGKARQLAEKINHPVFCIFIGQDVGGKAEELRYYEVDRIYTYDHVELKHFRVDLYANAFEDCIRRVKPAVVLVGATSIGRSLAPRLAVRFRTGLTADCTQLEIRDNTDLVQIRPAFGGNIMAQIATTHTRPQFATVRYKVMNQACRAAVPAGMVEPCGLEDEKLESPMKVLRVTHKEKQPGIAEAEVLVVAGRGVKEQKDLSLLEELAGLLKGQLAVTRPLVEAGWAHYTKQIGLSGRTVKPGLIITCGVSGAVQFTAGMNTSGCIIAVNKDKNAPIFKAAHYGMVGDLYEIVPQLLEKIRRGGAVHAV